MSNSNLEMVLYMSISFHKEEIELNLPKEEKLIRWLQQIVKQEDKVISLLTYIFCSDDYILNINRKYLNHDYYTDIITFPYKQGHEIESDIFISIDTVRTNAQEYKTTFDKELLRVIAHGLLHMIGYGDKTEEDQVQMTKMENQCLQLWVEIDKE